MADNRAVDISIGLPTGAAAASGAGVLDWAVRAEASGFAGVAVLDRVVSRGYEPLAVLAAVAGATRRVRLHASVVLAPTRETTLLARQAATIDALSGGRLVLGVGVGVRQDDYAATGFAFERRGRRLDEQLPALRRAWTGEPWGDGIGPVGPAPARTGGPELLVGGYTHRVAERIARWGDGFAAPGGGEPAAMRDLWARILDAWAAAGRAARPRWVGASYYALGPDAEAQASAYIASAYGFDPELAARRRATIPTTRAALEDLVAARRADGVGELILRPCAVHLDQLDRLAEVVAGA